MAANLDMTGNRANIAFLGSRNDVWHHMGQEMLEGMSIDQWAEAAGLGWQGVKVPAIASLEGATFDHIIPSERYRVVDDRSFVVRSDNGAPLGYVSGGKQNGYQVVQPREVLAWFEQYIAVDDRFKLDVAGALDGGKIIWATAIYRDGLDVAGDKHAARVLMSTTFDGSGSTINQATMTRTVCQNTLAVAQADKRAMIRTRHSTKFDAARVGEELSTLAQGFATFKKIGDAMAQHHMAKEEISAFFKSCLDIPLEAKRDDISTRKANQFADVTRAYVTTVKTEGAPENSAWAALNAITRYVDHDRSTSGNTDKAEARFMASTFGSGNAMKGKAMELLLPRIAERVLIAA